MSRPSRIHRRCPLCAWSSAWSRPGSCVRMKLCFVVAVDFWLKYTASKRSLTCPSKALSQASSPFLTFGTFLDPGSVSSSWMGNCSRVPSLCGGHHSCFHKTSKLGKRWTCPVLLTCGSCRTIASFVVVKAWGNWPWLEAITTVTWSWFRQTLICSGYSRDHSEWTQLPQITSCC